VLVAGVAIAAAAVAIFALVALGGSGEPVGENDVQIVARDTRFPVRVSARAGTFRINVRNRDGYRHTFVIEGQGVKSDMPSRSNRTVEVTLAPGSYRFYCDVPGHENMAGTLEIL
jgi:plastocyanin